MVILSCHEIGNGIDARGWLYSGMAIRLAFDLALNLDMSAYASKGDITPEDADLRRTVFWAAYLVDHQLGFHLGRPFRTSMEDVTVGKPHDQGNTLGPSRWIPYGLQDTTTGASGFLDCTEAVSRQLISLRELMAPCGYILYGTSSISKAVLQELNAKIVAQLRSMQYRQNIVYAHRPWMSKSGLQPQPPRGPGYLHAHEMCIQSAISISKNLILYEARYTLRRMNVKAVSITSSAILILLFASVSKHPTRSHSDIAMNLSTCFSPPLFYLVFLKMYRMKLGSGYQ
ncbi:hypothetical protein C8Q69DRAFT_45328 [Paecilomyces variotii]|uniref:Xylanolytic transcriptional activator regulatory domain-containing protein n=1 Tax=Byssochlamys spectabilis TaxID=264951 RepID=A0A443I7E9_BYSSP|nr:hypothetical protein C8Q69DRAFT_45328 [Paecilomyces variotii]RWR00025.1 hypothetical protein C8Q69DRAFT_45328 [Paecilomyces variotii]